MTALAALAWRHYKADIEKAVADHKAAHIHVDSR